jgi:hypothetical protein
MGSSYLDHYPGKMLHCLHTFCSWMLSSHCHCFFLQELLTFSLLKYSDKTKLQSLAVKWISRMMLCWVCLTCISVIRV